MVKIFKKIFGTLMIIAGIGLFFYPDISDWYLEQQTVQYISEFQDEYQKNSDNNSEESSEETDASQKTKEETSSSTAKEVNDEIDMSDDELYQEIVAYNASIYENGQAGFKDAWSYEQSPISLEGLSDGKFGYIQIPAMDVTLPLYVGASDSNMAKGAVILGQTSIPVGGKNTNSVIAGHRGWSTGNFFLDIEEISVGNMVYITNPWQTLAYRVESIDIINPYDSDAVKIQEGKDMVTLVTCHPYMSRGKYRYVVYCVRDKDAESDDMVTVKNNVSGKTADSDQSVNQEQSDGSPDQKNYITASDGTVYESSNELIQKENLIRRICGTAIILIVLFSFVYTRLRDRKSTDY